MKTEIQNNSGISSILCGKCKSKVLYRDYVPGSGEAGLACVICGNREGSRYGFIYPHKPEYIMKLNPPLLQHA
jgi:hypothetical protein